MTPTTRLRFVEREITVPLRDGGGMFAEYKKVRILQQWFELNSFGEVSGEWRDVPVEKED